MRAVSDAFLRTLHGSHTPVFRARVCAAGQSGTDPVGVEVEIVDGMITIDGQADVRTTMDITVKADWPQFQDSLLAPYDNEIFIERGIKFSDALIEWVGFGYLRIDTPEASDVRRNTPIRVECSDRMQGIIEARMETPRQFVSGTTFGVVVSNLVNEIYPSATIIWDDTANLATLTRSVIVEEDRYGFLNDAITSRGKIWYWRYDGALVIQSVPSTTGVDYVVNHGTNGVLTRMSRSLTRLDTFNIVVAKGEGADTITPSYGIARDEDPESPTYYLGPFGRVTRYYSSPFLGNDAQCTAAAQAILTRELGLVYDINFGTIVNPALEPYDVVEVKFSHDEPPQFHILDVVPIPLTPSGTMEADTRISRITLGG